MAATGSGSVPNMTDHEALRRWTEGYARAWESNDAADIGALFTDDARYFPEPHAAPWEGRETIVSEWLSHKDEPGDHTFRWEVMAVDGDLGFIRGWTRYLDPPNAYGNLWAVRLQDDGQAREFVEWWVRVREDTPPAAE
jgi:ketosteroid isomerase-like protein